nr:alpha/beta hydrolase [Pseudosulfitobacter koreense]
MPPDFRDAPKTSRFFEKIDLSNANLRNSDLSDLNFVGSKFVNADMSNSNLSMSNFGRANFTNADLSGVNARNSIFKSSKFENTTLVGIELAGATIEGATFIASNIPESQIEKVSLQTASVFADRQAFLQAIEPRLLSANKMEKSLPEFYEEEYDSGKSKKNRYDVFFATNRNPILERGELTGFGALNNNTLSLGVCEVIVPEGHRVGSLGSPLWKRLFNRKDDRLHIDHLISMNDELFWKLIRDTADRMKLREHPTIFVHGFNTTFEEAVLRSSQIGYDLGIGQGIALFSWPSKGKLRNYSADETQSEASKYFLANFIQDFTANSPTGKVNLIAHSMGCRCLAGALEVLSHKRVSTLKKVNQVIMAAADVDATIMPHQGGSVVKHCKRMTSYVSGLDRALKVSGWLHSYPRVGITPPTFVLNGMDTIIVNDLDLGDFSHAYLSSSRTILSDVFTLLKENTPPDNRHAIEPAGNGTAKYWRIKN